MDGLFVKNQNEKEVYFKRNDNQEGVRGKIADVAENVIVSRVVEKNQNESVVEKSE
mgnify:FL=1